MHFEQSLEAGDAAAVLDDGVAIVLPYDQAVSIVVERGLGKLRECTLGEHAPRRRHAAIVDEAGVSGHIAGRGSDAAVGGEVLKPGLLREFAGVGPFSVALGQSGAKSIVDGGVSGAHAQAVENATL